MKYGERLRSRVIEDAEAIVGSLGRAAVVDIPVLPVGRELQPRNAGAARERCARGIAPGRGHLQRIGRAGNPDAELRREAVVAAARVRAESSCRHVAGGNRAAAARERGRLDRAVREHNRSRRADREQARPGAVAPLGEVGALARSALHDLTDRRSAAGLHVELGRGVGRRGVAHYDLAVRERDAEASLALIHEAVHGLGPAEEVLQDELAAVALISHHVERSPGPGLPVSLRDRAVGIHRAHSDNAAVGDIVQRQHVVYAKMHAGDGSSRVSLEEAADAAVAAVNVEDAA